jgi:hypothetical protein
LVHPISTQQRQTGVKTLSSNGIHFHNTTPQTLPKLKKKRKPKRSNDADQIRKIIFKPKLINEKFLNPMEY